jgi:hypothetical protein
MAPSPEPAMSKRKSPEQRKREARRALVVLALATALFIGSVIHFMRVEGLW